MVAVVFDFSNVFWKMVLELRSSWTFVWEAKIAEARLETWSIFSRDVMDACYCLALKALCI